MLTIGEKIKQVRKLKGLSQENLAHDTGLSISTICRIENNTAEINSDVLKLVKKSLDIESAPLLPGEGTGFKERLYIWQKLTANRHLTEARALQKELVCITSLPFEKGLAMLYKLFEVRLVLAERNFAVAEVMLNELSLEEMDNESKYHYYSNLGYLHMNIGNDKAKTPLQYLLEAKKVEERPNGDLYYAIARCYTRLGLPFVSISYLEKSNMAYGNEKTIHIGLLLDNKLALNYIDMGETVKARTLLNKCLSNAKSIADESHIAVILHNMGCTYVKDRDWDLALDYFEHAALYYDEDNHGYLENLYYKTRCLIALRKFAQSKELIFHAAKFCRNASHYQVLFNSLSHMLTLRERKSLEYLENIALPHLLKTNNIPNAIDFCEILESQYEGKKALEIAKIQRDIYKRMCKLSIL